MRHGDLPPALRLLRPLVTTIIAGLGVHSMLMLAKDALGILPGFQPYEEFQRLLGGWAGAKSGGLVPCLTGAMIWGFLYARLRRHLPGRSFRARGLVFALIDWAVMSTGSFLLAGRGLFGLRMHNGLWPAAFMLPMLAPFSLVRGCIHSRMRPE